MKSLGIRNFDHVIVAIGENIQSSTLTTLILKELGVKKLRPKHKTIIMQRFWIKLVLTLWYIQKEIWVVVLHNVASASVLDYLELMR